MTLVSILTGPRRRPWHPVPPHWYPIHRSRRLLEEMGLRFRFFARWRDEAADCDVLFVSSDCLPSEAEPPERHSAFLQWLGRARDRVEALVWFDLLDGTGSSHWHVLPLVTAFLKKQLLRDQDRYQTSFYADRIYCDHLHRLWGVEDEGHPRHSPPHPALTHKIGLSWNLGLSDFRASSLPHLNLRHDYRELASAWRDPVRARPVDLTGLFNVDFARATTAAQRKRALETLPLLSRGRVVLGSRRLPKPLYLALLSRTRILLSLFGCGELCYREFEGFMAGAAILMPDVSHLETWPDVYRPHQTYWPLRWDLTDLEEAYSLLHDDEKLSLDLAHGGQELYRRQWTPQGRVGFCQRLESLVRGARAAAARERQTAEELHHRRRHDEAPFSARAAGQPGARWPAGRRGLSPPRPGSSS